MSPSTILAIIGTLATVVLGTFSIYLAIKRRYPGRITFVVEDSIGLFDSIVRNLTELAVLYKGEPVRKNLVLLKGFLVNTGTRDITDSMIEDKLEARLPEGYKWLTGKVVASSSNVRAEATRIDDQRLRFDVGLFRCDEFIRFEAVVEVPLEEATDGPARRQPGDALKEVLTFTHRIADTRRVNHEESPDVSRLGLVYGVILLLIPLLLVPFFWFTTEPVAFKQLTYLLKTNDKVVEVRLVAQNDGSLKLEGIDQPYNEVVSPSDLFPKHNLEPIVTPARRTRSPKRTFLLLGGVLELLALLMFFLTQGDYLRGRRMAKRLGLKS